MSNTYSIRSADGGLIPITADDFWETVKGKVRISAESNSKTGLPYTAIVGLDISDEDWSKFNSLMYAAYKTQFMIKMSNGNIIIDGAYNCKEIAAIIHAINKNIHDFVILS
jgi:hypothetical protein